MSVKPTERRDFLKLTGAGIAGSALGAATTVQPAIAKSKTSSAAHGTLDVRSFGATGDGKTLDTPAVNQAIDAAAAAGGGIVRFPAGNYLCYSIHLKSHITLFLDAGATIVAADAPAAGAAGGYDPPEPNAWDKFQDFGHSHWHNSLIWGEGLENISIEGQGLIWGKGLSRGDHDVVLAAGVGNKSISLKNCHNVTLRDISILHGGHFAILATGVDNLTIDNLKIDTNRDAIDIDCCRNVRVSNCSVNSPWDDGICLKDSYGLGFARSTDHVTITNCYVTGGYEEGTMLDAHLQALRPGFQSPAQRTHQVRHRKQWRLPQHHRLQLRHRGLQGHCPRVGGWRNPRRRRHHQHHHARHRRCSPLSAPGQPDARSRGHSGRRSAPHSDQQRCGLELRFPAGHSDHRNSRPHHRRRQAEQYSGAASRRRQQGGCRHPAAGTGKRLSRARPLRPACRRTASISVT